MTVFQKQTNVPAAPLPFTPLSATYGRPSPESLLTGWSLLPLQNLFPYSDLPLNSQKYFKGLFLHLQFSVSQLSQFPRRQSGKKIHYVLIRFH